MKKLDEVSQSTKPSTRVKYIILNLIEMRKNKWPETKGKKEGPKRIDEIYQDIENERQRVEANVRAYNRHERYYKNTHNDYGEYEDGGYGYDRQYRSPKSKMQKKVGDSRATQNKYYEPTRTEEKEITEDVFNKEEFIEKMVEHLERYVKDSKGVSFEEFKKIPQNIAAPEFTTSLFKSLINDGIITTKMQTDKEFLGKYLYSFSVNDIYKAKDLIQGLNSYVQSNFENDCEDNMNLKDVIANIYTQGVISQYILFEDIHLTEEKPDEEIIVYGRRINLGCKIIEEVLKVKDLIKEARNFFAQEIQVIIDKSEEGEIDEEVIERTKKKLEDKGSKEKLEKVMAFLEAENEKGFSETPIESIGTEEDLKDPLFATIFGEAIIKFILKNEKLNVVLSITHIERYIEIKWGYASLHTGSNRSS
jgi:hypothetical protein